MPTLPYARRYPNSAAGSSNLGTDVDELTTPDIRTSMGANKVVYASLLATESAGTAESLGTWRTTAHSSAWAVAAAAVAAVLLVVALVLDRFGMERHPTQTPPTPTS